MKNPFSGLFHTKSKPTNSTKSAAAVLSFREILDHVFHCDIRSLHHTR